MTGNAHFQDLATSYLFSEINRRVTQYASENPAADIIRLGIGDVTQPLPPAVIRALHAAVDEMGDPATFKGYGPEQGYAFLRETIAREDFHARGCEIAPDEIFVSDGAKSDTANFSDLFGPGNRIGVPNPVYPVYYDSNVMAGHFGAPTADGFEHLRLLPCRAERNFEPSMPSEPIDILYLCSPNNPTGVAMNRAQLTRWVDYALAHGAILLFDAAYEAFIREEDIPHSIFEIEGAAAARWSFAPFQKPRGLPAFAARTRWCRRISMCPMGSGAVSPFTRCGSGGRPQNTTGCPTLSSGRRPPSMRRKAGRSAGHASTGTSTMPAGSGTRSLRAASPSGAA
jgi:LL-diaminopimelate aminotransferase